MLNTAEIISKFELYVDDGTELSSQEELDLANKIYQSICSFRPWEFLKTPYSATIINNEIALPGNFAYISSNNQSSDSSVSQETETAPKGVFVGPNYTFVRMINFSDRRRHQNENVCYIDPSDSTIKFVTTQTDTTAEFDYIKIPTDLELSTGPIFPARFWDIIAYGMATDDFAIQLFDKARSYAGENQVKFNSILKDMGYWNAQSFLN